MNMKKIILVLVLTATVFGLQEGRASTDFGYGLYLFRQGNYSGAIFELERYIYYNETDPLVPYLNLVLALSYAQSLQYDSALAVLSSLAAHLDYGSCNEGDYELSCESAFHILNIYFRQRRFYDFYLKLEEVGMECPILHEDLAQYVAFMSLAGHVYNLAWEKALEELALSEISSSHLRNLLEGEIKVVLSHRNKSPLVGGFLSLVPGLGHLYAGRFPDGLRSFFINATFVSLAVFSFKEQMPVLGGIFTAIEGILYVSNIYGGVNAVLQENARFIIEKRDYLLKHIPVPPLDIITVRKELNL
jgi:hypothetical protein